MKQTAHAHTSLWWFDYGRRLFKTLGIRSCNCPCCYFKSSAKGPTDRQAIKIAPPPPRFLFPFLRQSGRVGGVSQTLPFFACSTFYFPYLSLFPSPLCVCGSFLRVRPWKTEEKRPAKQCVSGWIFLKKIYAAASSFPFHFFSSKVLCIVLGNRRACPTFYFDALRGPVLFLFFSFGRSHCLISVLRA